MPTPIDIRIIKLGGSLFEATQTPQLVQAWLKKNPEPRNVWLTGGGRWADEVRRFDQTQTVSATSIHWAAISAMSLTANLLAGWFPSWPQVSSCDQLDRWQQADDGPTNVILSTESILRRLKCDLPCSWDVTSDSIAAWLAVKLSIPQLVLLKACEIPDNDPQALAQLGIVDRYLPTIDLSCIEFRCVNLVDWSNDSTVSVNRLQ